MLSGDPDKSDRFGFSLAAEGGLNDGAAFAFVLPDLGPLGLAYGIDQLGLASGFFAVFAAGLALQRMVIGWFGIRGIGSLFYLLLALQFDLSGDVADTPLLRVALVQARGLRGAQRGGLTSRSALRCRGNTPVGGTQRDLGIQDHRSSWPATAPPVCRSAVRDSAAAPPPPPPERRGQRPRPRSPS